MSYLPELPDLQPDTILIACLCLPTAPDGREKLDEALEGCLSPKTRNTPELKVVSVLDCNRQKKLEKERKEGFATCCPFYKIAKLTTQRINF